MLLRHLWVLVTVVGCLMLVGCQKKTSDEQLVEIAVKLEKQQSQLDRIDRAVESIGERFHELETSRVAGPAVGGAAPTAAVGEAKEAGFRTGREYQDIMGQIAVIQSQLINLEQEFLSFRQGEEKVRKRRERELLRDQGAAWRAMGEPDELSRRLDGLLTTFSGSLEDPLTRDAFAADVEEMKSRYSVPLSAEQKREQARTAIVEAMDIMPDDQSRKWLEGELRAFDEATNPLEVATRVTVTLQLQRMREMGELAQRYNIPAQVMRDAGLLFLPREGLYGVPQ